MSHTPDCPDARGRLRRLWRPVALLVIVAAFSVFFIYARRARGIRSTEQLRSWIEGFGAWGPAVFVAVRAAAALALIPGSGISGAAGLLFRLPLAVAYVLLARTLGACAAFLTARHLARSAVARWLEEGTRASRLDELVARHGALVVALGRLLPIIPDNVLSYAFGLTGVRFRTYLVCSVLGMLPWTFIVVASVDLVATIGEAHRIPYGQVAAVGGAVALTLAAAVALAVALYVRARRGRAQAGGAEPPEASSR